MARQNKKQSNFFRYLLMWTLTLFSHSQVNNGKKNRIYLQNLQVKKKINTLRDRETEIGRCLEL